MPRPIPTTSGFLAALLAACAHAATARGPGVEEAEVLPSDASLVEHVERFAEDRRSLTRFWRLEPSAERYGRLETFDRAWLERLGDLDFEALDLASKIDHVLLRVRLEYLRTTAERDRARLDGLVAFLPFAEEVVTLEEARWRVEPLDHATAARQLDRLAQGVAGLRGRVVAEGGEDPAEDALAVSAVDALWLAGRVGALRGALAEWYRHYDEYVPGFAWWCEEPYGRLRKELGDYAEELREEIAGQKGEEDDPLVGDPIGAEGLAADLALELIPYTPAELIAIGEAEFEWCEREMKRAAADLGLGDDWRAALERVKADHVPPGEQDALVAAQAREAIAFLDAHDLVTIPQLCRDTWRVRMISREGQRNFPFAAYGGQRMDVAFATADMDHDAKRMSMRGNNVHFTRAVTPHELIPGHHLQRFMADRYATHRRSFSTPFLVEGWALYWEMLEWDLGWPKTPENRIGMLFWRMHRAARIVVSLGFHLERMTPQEMIDFLVERVGHERDNATAEVRRFIGGSYSPLYQCAYMIGGLQLRALAADLVDGGRMTPREFHDAVLRLGPIPIEMMRAALTGVAPERDHRAAWRFAGEVDTR